MSSGQKTPIWIKSMTAIAFTGAAVTCDVNAAPVDRNFLVDRVNMVFDVVFTPASTATLTIDTFAQRDAILDALGSAVNFKSTLLPNLVNVMTLSQYVKALQSASGYVEPANFGLPPVGLTLATATSHGMRIVIPIEFEFPEHPVLRGLARYNWSTLRDGGLWSVTPSATATVTLGAGAGTSFTLTGNLGFYIEGAPCPFAADAAVMEYFREVQSSRDAMIIKTPGLYAGLAIDKIAGTVGASNYGLDMAVDGSIVYQQSNFDPKERARAYCRAFPNAGLAATFMRPEILGFIPLIETARNADKNELAILDVVNIKAQSSYSNTETLTGCRLLRQRASGVDFAGGVVADANNLLKSETVQNDYPGLTAFLPRVATR